MKYFFVLVALVTLSCGASIDLRIVGGEEAADGQFPYQASLNVYTIHLCGGSIINNKWILTSAHCIKHWIEDINLLKVVVGTNSFNVGGTTYKVDNIIYHERYGQPANAFDVGLVKIVGEIIMNEKVQPIELNTEYIGEGHDLVFSGWGSTTTEGPLPDKLRFIKLTSIAMEECKVLWTGSEWPPVIDSEFCTFTKRGEGACTGDSGSPLVLKGKIVGIFAWGMPCAQGKPDVFTRVSSFIDWINITMIE